MSLANKAVTLSVDGLVVLLASSPYAYTELDVSTTITLGQDFGTQFGAYSGSVRRLLFFNAEFGDMQFLELIGSLPNVTFRFIVFKFPRTFPELLSQWHYLDPHLSSAHHSHEHR